MNAREFLAQKQARFEERDLIKEPLTLAELQALAKRIGSVRELIAPKRVKELESVADEKILPMLAEDPKLVRRPIIDTGKAIHLGFRADVREKLGL